MPGPGQAPPQPPGRFRWRPQHGPAHAAQRLLAQRHMKPGGSWWPPLCLQPGQQRNRWAGQRQCGQGAVFHPTVQPPMTQRAWQERRCSCWAVCMHRAAWSMRWGAPSSASRARSNARAASRSSANTPSSLHTACTPGGTGRFGRGRAMRRAGTCYATQRRREALPQGPAGAGPSPRNAAHLSCCPSHSVACQPPCSALQLTPWYAEAPAAAAAAAPACAAAASVAWPAGKLTGAPGPLHE